ncbi:hypothetical protein FA95DRAFT_767818 [Auriscalpium vulgare]|uniref:Uncharacterized protein n=1 Tax=Auriscalpium vulgare TaxID=40419 RepID=A0ACB8RBF8_9AGAM|nr:hypothetical protein FA95DRAFT_767818 [Auriscalpium vulgare]
MRSPEEGKKARRRRNSFHLIESSSEDSDGQTSNSDAPRPGPVPASPTPAVRGPLPSPADCPPPCPAAATRSGRVPRVPWRFPYFPHSRGPYQVPIPPVAHRTTRSPGDRAHSVRVGQNSRRTGGGSSAHYGASRSNSKGSRPLPSRFRYPARGALALLLRRARYPRHWPPVARFGIQKWADLRARGPRTGSWGWRWSGDGDDAGGVAPHPGDVA